jgi:hypothetical protein
MKTLIKQQIKEERSVLCTCYLDEHSVNKALQMVRNPGMFSAIAAWHAKHQTPWGRSWSSYSSVGHAHLARQAHSCLPGTLRCWAAKVGAAHKGGHVLGLLGRAVDATAS